MGKALALLRSMGVKAVMELPDTAAAAVDTERDRRARRKAARSAGAKADA